jgi:hypothetical protein
MTAHPLLRPDLCIRCLAAKYARNGPLHSRNDHVLGLDLPPRLGSAALQVPGPRYAVGRIVFDRRMGCTCSAGTAGFTQTEIETIESGR